jgi:beta-xylosidase
MALRVATSDRPEGPYTDTGTPLVECTGNRFAIDAHPFRDVDGRWYLFYAATTPRPAAATGPAPGSPSTGSSG